MQQFLDAVSVSTPRVGIGRTLADCQAIAAKFDNTCDGTAPIDLSTHAGEVMTCTGQMMCPDGSGSVLYTDDSPCTFTRKLCATCDDSSGDVKIRLQTNQMPNHCMQAINANPISTNYGDWEVIFNRDVTS